MRRTGILLSLTAAAAAVAVTFGHGSSTSYAIDPATPTLAADLANANVRFTAVPPGATAPLGVDAAVGAARRSFGGAHVASVYLGRVTNTDYATPKGSLVVADRLAYVVRFDGLTERPLGARGAVSPSALHHELLVVIDATTGDMLFGTTVR